MVYLNTFNSGGAMTSDSVYEFPLTERIKNFMRLENSFAQIGHFTARNNIWDSQASMLVLLEVLGVMERHDIKNEILKELERNIGVLTCLLDAPNVSHQKLEETLDELHTHVRALQTISGKGSKSLREDDLLSTIRQRTSIVSGINSFEIPGYYYWLNQNDGVRQQQIDQWLADTIPIADAISLALDLIRNSADFAGKIAQSGFFQATLQQNQACQMLRICLPLGVNYFPETSGNKHRISVRFLSYENTKQRPTQVSSNINFDLSCCGI